MSTKNEKKIGKKKRGIDREVPFYCMDFE